MFLCFRHFQLLTREPSGARSFPNRGNKQCNCFIVLKWEIKFNSLKLCHSGIGLWQSQIKYFYSSSSRYFWGGRIYGAMSAAISSDLVPFIKHVAAPPCRPRSFDKLSPSPPPPPARRHQHKKCGVVPGPAQLTHLSVCRIMKQSCGFMNTPHRAEIWWKLADLRLILRWILDTSDNFR